MSYRLVGALETLRAQLDETCPNRSKISDGWIGDADHANRSSDHNPHCGAPSDPTVTAIDLTHDPENEADMRFIAETLRASKDPRIKYVIFQGRMFSSYATSTHAAWTWRPYSGVNAHAAHMHVSVQCNASKDSTRQWQIGEWSDMATKAEIREVMKEEIAKAVQEIKEDAADNRRILAVGKTQKTYDPDNHNLKALKKAGEGSTDQ